VRRLEVLNALVLGAIRHLDNLTSRRRSYMLKLDSNQWNLVYNIFSFGLVSMLACTIYTLVSQQRVLAKYRNALVMSSMVTFIAGYHYMRIFNSFNESSADMTINVSGAQGSFNEAYRYVDWLLTVPLLLVEVIAVLALAKEVSRSLIMRLVPASAAMIALGYPGEISNDQNTQVMYGVLSTLPFLYILYVLFVELGKSLDRQPAGVAETVGRLRLLLIATWGVYPISYILGMGGDATAEQFVGVQVGYTIADILAKCVFGLTILKIARMKSMAEGMKEDH
jgi:bacteriorhodopsin